MQPSAPAFPLPDQAEPLEPTPVEELEIVDFSDFARFAGIPALAGQDPKTSESKVPPSARPSRPVASDFFDLQPTTSQGSTVPSKADTDAWRRRPVQSHAIQQTHTANSGVVKLPLAEESGNLPSLDVSPPRVDVTTITLPKDATADISNHSLGHANGHQQRAPRGQTFYKEAKMSALDDVISRIKGAIEEAGEASRELVTHPEPVDTHPPAVTAKTPAIPLSPARFGPSREQRWVPPALRPRNPDFDEAPEVFAVTGCEPPRSPRLALYAVGLPNAAMLFTPLDRRQLLLFERPPAQWDVPSWEPPLPSMKHYISENDAVFGLSFRGKPRVALPKARRRVTDGNASPRVNLPSAPPGGKSSIVRVREADTLSTWRKQAVQVVPTPAATGTAQPDPTLSTTSRSPPPELPAVGAHEHSPTPSLVTAAKVDGSRPRSQPKMPAGSSVAVYRDSRIDAVEMDQVTVNFIVTSELEDAEKLVIPQDLVQADVDGVNAPSAYIPKRHLESPESVVPPLLQSKVEGSDDSVGSL